MMKRVLTILLLVLCLVLVPILAGCEDEIKSEQHKEVHDRQKGEPVEVVE